MMGNFDTRPFRLVTRYNAKLHEQIFQIEYYLANLLSFYYKYQEEVYAEIRKF